MQDSFLRARSLHIMRKHAGRALSPACAGSSIIAKAKAAWEEQELQLKMQIFVNHSTASRRIVVVCVIPACKASII